MAEAKAVSMEDARAKDKAERRKDLAVCVIGLALVFLTKLVA